MKILKRKWNETLVVLYIGTSLMLLTGQLLGILLVYYGLNFGISLFADSFVQSDVWAESATYLLFIGIWIVALLWIGGWKSNRPILRQLGPRTSGNNWRFLLIGAAAGAGMNGLCILAAWLHQDIHFSYVSFQPIALLLILITVLIQSSAEELCCRVFLYQKLLKSYRKPAVAIIGNAFLFAFLHIMNPSVTILSLLNTFLTGILFSLVVYYFESVWCVFAIHTLWNFTQNILFGLPNSGFVSLYSVFRLDDSTARDSFAYDVAFGVEGTVFADLLLIVAIVLMIFIGRKYRERCMLSDAQDPHTSDD